MSKPFSRQLAEVILQSSEAALPEDCFHWAKMAIIDTIGVTLAGVATETAQIPRRVMPAKTGPSQIIGVDQKSDPVTASLLNGTAAHALDFDDMTQNMMGHPSVAILPAALALADAHQCASHGHATPRVFLAEARTNTLDAIDKELVCQLFHPLVL